MQRLRLGVVSLIYHIRARPGARGKEPHETMAVTTLSTSRVRSALDSTISKHCLAMRTGVSGKNKVRGEFPVQISGTGKAWPIPFPLRPFARS